jgi:hypothetical protein
LGRVAEEIGAAEAALPVLAREREAGELPLTVGVVEDHVVPFGGARPIAVGRLRDQDLLADRDVEHPPQTGRNSSFAHSRYSAKFRPSFR